MWIRCKVAQNIGAETVEVKEANFGLNGVEIEESNSEQPQMEENMFRKYTVQEEENGGKAGGTTTSEQKDSNNDVDVADDDDVNDEAKPLLHALNIEQSVVERKRDVLERLDTTNWHQYTFEFLDDMLFLVKKKDIYPKLFKVKLNSVLLKTIGGVIFSLLATSFKVIWAP